MGRTLLKSGGKRGAQTRVYETLAGSDPNPITAIPISQLNDRYHEIENILSPTNLAKHCNVDYDRKLKLCNGLGSSASIRSGVYKISEWEYRILLNGVDQTEPFRANVPQVTQFDEQMEMLKTVFELRVVEGSAARDENGRITAQARFGGATLQNAAAMQMIGIDEISFTTSEKFLSTDADNPTMFDASKDYSITQGAMIPLFLGGMQEMNCDVEGSLFIKISMYFDGKDMLGQYRCFSDYNVKLPFRGALKFEMGFIGTFV